MSRHRSVFLYGFAKNERDHIGNRELDDLKKLAKHYLSYTDAQLAVAVSEQELRELICDDRPKHWGTQSALGRDP
jgi:hypothetical protein